MSVHHSLKTALVLRAESQTHASGLKPAPLRLWSSCRRLHIRSYAEGLNSNYNGIHHIGVLCKDISASLTFYRDILGMEVNPERPDDKLPYRGAWLWVGGEMIHLMELPNPDPLDGRPEHGGRDRHVCLSVNSIQPVEDVLRRNGIVYTKSKSGRAALFFRDPDENVLEMAEQ